MYLLPCLVRVFCILILHYFAILRFKALSHIIFRQCFHFAHYSFHISYLLVCCFSLICFCVHVSFPSKYFNLHQFILFHILLQVFLLFYSSIPFIFTITMCFILMLPAFYIILHAVSHSHFICAMILSLVKVYSFPCQHALERDVPFLLLLEQFQILPLPQSLSILVRL